MFNKHFVLKDHMVAHISTVAFEGLDITKVDVQVQVTAGLPNFIIVGLPDKAVAESKERVRAALNAIGLSLPTKRVVVNLAPSDITKIGSHYDLPIAVGLLVAMKIIPQDAVERFYCMGELSLDGSILPVNGILPTAVRANGEEMGIICPEKQGAEAAWAGEIDIVAPYDILSLINHFKGTQVLPQPNVEVAKSERIYPDLRDIKGQETAKRALEIAAAGGHNMLMIGPPGTGKSMLSSRLIGLLPPLTSEEILEVSTIYSVAGMLAGTGLTAERPYRDPHHSTSMPAMVGGGKRAQPGEVSLAHKGVLFLDELPEFNRDVLESLRQPIETASVTVSRVHSHVTYPARFQLVAAMNPCRCGYVDDADRACTKVPKCAIDYQSKISGPFYDRMDLFIEVPALKPQDMVKIGDSEPTEKVAQRVLKARDLQLARGKMNNEMDGEALEGIVKIEDDAKALLMQAVENFGISMRGYNRILRVGRTIADLAASEATKKSHIAEAISYRKNNYR